MVQTATVLLVDDDEDDILIFKEVLQTEIGYDITVLVANDGLECLAVLENIVPDIIFLDVNMPLMDGKQCLTKLKNSSDFKHIPVVMYSTTRHEMEIDQFKKLGASFLSKPVSIDEFLEPLRTVLSQHLVK